MADTKTPTKRAKTAGTSGDIWTDEERAAIQEAARERRVASRRSPAEEREAGEADVRAKIASLDEPDHALAQRIHEIVRSVAPDLVPRTWYGSPAYSKNGNVVCYFQERAKFKARYATFGFSDKAHLDDDAMWPTSYALTSLTPAVEERIAALVKKAAG
jgi:uncharacterized protein YdhG (YjbR/CyaY superfamily)